MNTIEDTIVSQDIRGEQKVDDEIDDQLKCSICQDLMVCPVTLLCQHSFCRLCIKSYVHSHNKPGSDDDGFQRYVPRREKNAKCPLCRCAIVIPTNDNFILKDVISTRYPDKYKARMEEHDKDALKLDIRDQIEEEIRNEIFGAVVDEAIHENNDGDSGNTNQIVREFPGTFVNVSNRSWISKIFGSKSTLSLVWVIILASLCFNMSKLNVGTKAFIGCTVIWWCVYVYLIINF